MNGEVRQDAPLADMLFSVSAIISFVTEVMMLEPGDLIATGTPPGVGSVDVGAVVHVEIPGVGALTNRVVEA